MVPSQLDTPQQIKTIRFGGVNSYLVKTNDSGYVLIDTGFSSKRTDIEKELESAGCKPGNLKLIIITHGDSDYAGNCAFFREKYGTRIAMHRNELDAVESGNPVLTKKIGRDFKGIMVRMILFFYKLKKADRFKPDVFIEDGDSLREYDLDAQVLHIQGHSNGSIGILTGDGDLFCGDLLRNSGKKPSPGFGIFDQMGFDASIKKLEGLKITIVYPGHGKPFPMERFLRNHSKESTA
jgi:hydroxyacylglutathione hydrolase